MGKGRSKCWGSPKTLAWDVRNYHRTCLHATAKKRSRGSRREGQAQAHSVVSRDLNKRVNEGSY